MTYKSIFAALLSFVVALGMIAVTPAAANAEDAPKAKTQKVKKKKVSKKKASKKADKKAEKEEASEPAADAGAAEGGSDSEAEPGDE
ncbi:hypothetical protein GC174_09975 [bacterium]|nr:hypothetical protein [bacterium]